MKKIIQFILLVQFSLSMLAESKILKDRLEARIDVSVFDTQTANALEEGYFSYINVKSGKQVFKSFDEASFTVPPNTLLYIKVYSQGYTEIRDTLFVKSYVHDTLINLIYALQKSTVTGKLTGKNTGKSFPSIYFDSGKYDIREDAQPVLMDVVTFMHTNPNSCIELGGFADCRGFEQNNLSLAQKRAKTSLDYITSHGINSSRIKTRAYGAVKGTLKCTHKGVCPEAEYSEGRQVKFKVIRSEGIDYNNAQKNEESRIDDNIRPTTETAEVVGKKSGNWFKFFERRR